MNEAFHQIAVVDDEPSMCRALERLLRAAGFAVETFLSGEDFLQSLLSRTPDCVILDLHMPSVTGFEVQAHLVEARIGVPVIVITGHDSPATRERALLSGAAAYLTKPVSEDVLLAAIGDCVARQPEAPDSGEPALGDRAGKRSYEEER
jgi:FixJ family two-component response regulator